MNAVLQSTPAPNVSCPMCLSGKLATNSRDTFCLSCGDKLVPEGSTWFDGHGVVQVIASFLDRKALPYCVVQHRNGVPRVVSQGLMLREWQCRPGHHDNAPRAASQGNERG